ncbi:MAG TPA: RCC1 domain-containing protein, partial [Kofleriaceae bacterium]|nr:RCC1 domain-containing protein [Kofleriaceae bacterium]
WCWEPNQPSVEVPELFGARTIAMGREHSCAVLDGDVVCKGNNQSGELGDGTNIDHDKWMHVAW